MTFKFDPKQGVDDSDFDIYVEGPPCVHCKSWKPKKLCNEKGKFENCLLCHAGEEDPPRVMEPNFACFRDKEEKDEVDSRDMEKDKPEG